VTFCRQKALNYDSLGGSYAEHEALALDWNLRFNGTVAKFER